jgi:hypothetical protein
MSEEQLRKAALAASDGVITEGIGHLRALCAQIDRKQLVWKSAPVPKPNAMRAFEGRSNEYTVLVTQFNEANDGVQHRGMAVCHKGGPMVVVIPPAIAEYAYRSAVAVQN